MKRTPQILAPLSVDHYVDEADLEASPGRSERSYSKASWQKIKAVKDKYDPDGCFIRSLIMADQHFSLSKV